MSIQFKEKINKTPLRNGDVNSKDIFPEAFERFTKFEPVRVSKELKHEFHHYITEQIRERNIWFWSAECQALKTCYKFKRTS